jgi:protein O-mannosyl-transferase
MTRAGAAWLAAATAVLVYLPALHNSFALDDGTIVERNPAAHSVAAALHAFDRPYWPVETQAGQWRPLVILSFAADWQLSGGSTIWLHAANVLWHAAATGLLVLVLAAYLPAAGALAGGLLFAVHPVHVEAVANLVGRAEMMAACFLFLALLIARTIRRRAAERRATWWAELLLLLAVAAALLSKEHAAVAIALLALDDLATRTPDARALPWRDYAGVALLTLGWFLLRRPIDAGRSFAMIAPAFFGLGSMGRISTMLPAVLVLVRLLVWPFDLSPDYNPEVIPRLQHLTLLGAAGAVVLLACAALALASWRRHRALSAGLWIVGIAWLPTSNLLFPTGVVIAERTLYLASAGAVLAGAAGLVWLASRKGARTAAALGAVVVLAFGVRTVAQIPIWHDNRDLVLWALTTHPDAYREHEAAARALVRLGNLPAALREYGIAAELYPFDPYLCVEAASAAVDAGRVHLARRYLADAARLSSTARLVGPLLARIRLRADSAAAAARPSPSAGLQRLPRR